MKVLEQCDTDGNYLKCMNKKQYNRLPKYAKEEINLLNIKIKELEYELKQISFNESTNIICKTGITNNVISLPENSQITFITDNTRFDVSVVDNELRIYGMTSINIRPRAGNSIYIC